MTRAAPQMEPCASSPIGLCFIRSAPAHSYCIVASIVMLRVAVICNQSIVIQCSCSIHLAMLDPKLFPRAVWTFNFTLGMKRNGKASDGSKVKKAAEKEKAGATTYKHSPAPPPSSKLTPQQAAELLKGFWAELLQNNLRQVKKLVLANRGSVDFRVARFAPASDGTALHLCAQHGFLSIARLLFDELKVADVDLQNKVGSTPLHVACKFGQDDMIYFLLERNARVDIPDNQNRIAFDVASFAVVDRCILAPMREEQQNAQHIKDGLCLEEAAALAELEEAERENRNAEMELADAESHAFAEQELLCASQVLDREWNGRLQIAKTEQDRHRDEYQAHQQMLDEARENIRDAQEKLQEEVEQDHFAAQERQNHAQSHLNETISLLKVEQEALDNQLGLFDAAHLLSNDPVVQEWVLVTITALVDTSRTCEPNGGGFTHTAWFLAREEFLTVVSNVLARFPTTRHLQWRALEAIAVLITYTDRAIRSKGSPDDREVLVVFLESFLKSKKPGKSILSQCRDALGRYSSDVEMNIQFARVCYLLLRRRQRVDESQALLFTVKFSHETRNQCLPLDMLRLYQNSKACNVMTHVQIVEIVRDAAFLLFTVAKCNVIKSLLGNGVVTLTLFWIEEISSLVSQSESDLQCFEAAKETAIQLLLGALSFVHMIPRPSTVGAGVVAKTDCADATPPNRLEDIYPWTTNEIHTILATTTLDDQLMNKQRLHTAFWMIKLLRNIALHFGEAASLVRIELYSPSTFSALSQVAISLLQLSNEANSNDKYHTSYAIHDFPSRDAVVGVWLDLVDAVWVRHYNLDGQLRATAEFALEHIAALITWQSGHLRHSHEYSDCLHAHSRALGTLALVLSNGKNARKFRDLSQVLDKATQQFLRWLISLHASIEKNSATIEQTPTDEIDQIEFLERCGQVSSSVIFEALSHVLHIYIALLTDQRESEAATSQMLHDRCREVGICAVLRAFRLRNADGVDEHRDIATGSASVIGLVRSLKGMKSTRCTKTQPSITYDLQTLHSLSRSIIEMTRCKC